MAKSGIDYILVSKNIFYNILHGETKLHVGSCVLSQLPSFSFFTFDETHGDVCVGRQLAHLVVEVLESIALRICTLVITVQDQP